MSLSLITLLLTPLLLPTFGIPSRPLAVLFRGVLSCSFASPVALAQALRVTAVLRLATSFCRLHSRTFYLAPALSFCLHLSIYIGLLHCTFPSLSLSIRQPLH